MLIRFVMSICHERIDSVFVEFVVDHFLFFNLLIGLLETNVLLLQLLLLILVILLLGLWVNRLLNNSQSLSRLLHWIHTKLWLVHLKHLKRSGVLLFLCLDEVISCLS